MAKRVTADLRPSANPNAEHVPEAEERILAELASEGLIARGEGAMSTFTPLRIAGKSLAETLLEDRNDRL